MENNKYLLDTHIFIWLMEKNKRISNRLVSLLRNPENDIFLSVVTVWEMIIKKRKKKLRISGNIESGVKATGFRLLPIELNHVLAVDTVPNYHADPFDRILIAQSMAENLTLITSDEKIWKYPVKVLRA